MDLQFQDIARNELKCSSAGQPSINPEHIGSLGMHTPSTPHTAMSFSKNLVVACFTLALLIASSCGAEFAGAVAPSHGELPGE